MYPFSHLTSFKPEVSNHQLEVAGPYHLIFDKVLQTLYPQQPIHWNAYPIFKDINTYVLFYLCLYGIEEKIVLEDGFQRIQWLLKNCLFKSNAHILIVLYRDLKVAFPDRKLQREKVMSKMVTEAMLEQQTFSRENCIQVTHEFGTHQLQDTLQQLKGAYLFFEVKSYL